MTSPDAVVVVIPVHDEEALLPRCLRATAAAAAPLRGSGVRVRVVTVLDDCRDASGEIAERMRGHDDLVIQVAVRRVGLARDIGARAGLDGMWGGGAPWVVFSDADSAARTCWLIDHLRLSATGRDCVAGGVELIDRGERRGDLDRRWAQHTWQERRRERIYGANLGVRADALGEIGGVPHATAGEDQGIWDLLGSAERPRTARPGLTIATSARRSTRTPDGLSHFLDDLLPSAAAA